MRVLIVEDEREDGKALSAFARHLGHTAFVVASTKDALGTLGRQSFDLVLTELRSARVDGMTLLRSVRRRWPATHVAMIAGPRDGARVESARRGGAVDCLHKPFDRWRLHGLLDRAFGAPETPSEEKADFRGGPRSSGSQTDAFDTGKLRPSVLGDARLEPAPSETHVGKVLRIDATDAPPNLLARLLVGSYVTGHDQVLITSRPGFRPSQREEIHRMVDRLLGMTVVGDSSTMVEVQDFIDPGRYELPRLLPHVVQLLQAEIAQCQLALTGTETPHLDLIETIEEEIDQFYLLMVRQLLLSSDSPRIAHSIDVESHRYQIGYRVVAKILELMGDMLQRIGAELRANLRGLRELPPPVLRELSVPLRDLDHLLARTMNAFTRLSVGEANANLDLIHKAVPKDTALGERILHRIHDATVAVAAERITCDLVMALELLTVVNEVTINRSMEPETAVRRGSRIRIGPVPTARRSPKGPIESPLRHPEEMLVPGRLLGDLHRDDR